MPDEELEIPVRKAMGPEVGQTTVNAALERMRQKKLAGWVLDVIESYAPGFDPRGSAPHFESAARQANCHIHYKSIVQDGKPAYFILLTEKPRITPIEQHLIMAAWQAWRRQQPQPPAAA